MFFNFIAIFTVSEMKEFKVKNKMAENSQD